MKTYKTISRLLLGAFALVLGACGTTTLDKEEATGVMQVALDASESASTSVASGVSGWPVPKVNVEFTGDHFEANGLVTNSEGGGTVSVVGEGTKTSVAGFDGELSITIENWQDQDKHLLLSGELHVSISSMAISDKMAAINAKYSGELEVSGSTNGTVTFDLTVKTTFSETGFCKRKTGQVGGAKIDTSEGC